MADVKTTSAYLILNPASGSAAVLLRRLTRAARELGIRVCVLEPGEDARHAALEAADDGARVLPWPAATGRWRRLQGWLWSATCPSWR